VLKSVKVWENQMKKGESSEKAGKRSYLLSIEERLKNNKRTMIELYFVKKINLFKVIFSSLYKFETFIGKNK
jgi:hypothetical protein